MAIILDADVIIRGEKGAFDLKNWVASRPNDRFEVAAITVAELWHGVERAAGKHRTTRERYLRAVLEPLPILAYTEQTAYEHARVWSELRVSGKMIGFYDLLVAATALERGSSVATFNKRHFTRIRGARRHRAEVAPRKERMDAGLRVVSGRGFLSHSTKVPLPP